MAVISCSEEAVTQSAHEWRCVNLRRNIVACVCRRTNLPLRPIVALFQGSRQTGVLATQAQRGILRDWRQYGRKQLETGWDDAETATS
jgi:hypothetical protein